MAMRVIHDDPVLGALEGVERDAGPLSGFPLMTHVGVSPGPYHESFEQRKLLRAIHTHAYLIFNDNGNL
jgi:hypothetical protein